MNYVFGNGHVFVGDAARTWANAVAVSDGRIVAVGPDADVRAAVDGAYEFVDIDGGLLLAGFQDAHVHPTMGGLNRLQCNLEYITDLPSALEAISAYASAHEGEWILGGGWNYGWFEGGNPSAELLDGVSARPTYFVGADGHSGWANSAALERAGITALSTDPTDGRIERFPDGAPQGTLHEGAMALMESVVPETSSEDVRNGLLEGQRFLLSLGITGWQDAWVEASAHETYVDLAERGELKASVRGALWWDRLRGIEQLDEHIERTRQGVGKYDPRTIKLMLDGVCENHTAALLGPYHQNGEPGDNSGLDFIDPRQLAEIVTAIDGAGLQCHFHALGDRAVRLALDAIEAARRSNGWSDTRPHLAHLQIVDPTDVPRFRQLGATANAQPLWSILDDSMTDLTIPFIGPERARNQYPWRSLLNAGASMAMGSDWPVSTPDVMKQIDVAVYRNAPALDIDDVFLEHERIGMADALVAFTAGSAYVNHRDDQSGTIACGKDADLVLLAGNPFERGRTERIDVAMTMVGGEVMFEREAV